MKDKYFIPFISKNVASLIPDRLNDPFDSTTPEICKIAATELQAYLWLLQSSGGENQLNLKIENMGDFTRPGMKNVAQY